MTDQEFNIFDTFRKEFKNQAAIWNQKKDELTKLQKEAAVLAKTPPYSFETAVVYNKALDEITINDEIKLIVIGDNPGKDEQLAKNNKYLVGQAGKLGEGFFKKNPELKTDFRKNVIILNKTPVHSAKTNQLKTIEKNGSQEIKDLLKETQIWMAQKTAFLHKNLKNSQIWLVGYSELKPKGIFSLYRDTLKDEYKASEDWNRVKVFQHFSMNRFSIDLNDFMNKNPALSLEEAVNALGTIHRDEIFGK